VLGLVLFNIAWNQGPIAGWSTPYVYVLLILGVFGFVAFILVERKVKDPILPLSIFNSKFAYVLICVALGWSSFGIWVFFLWDFILNLRGLTPLLAVAQFSPVTISGFVAAMLTGILIRRVPAAVLILAAMLAFCIGNILVATAPVEQTYWANVFVATLITPFGMDITVPAATMILSSSTPHEMQGVAASLVNTIVNYSISIGLGIGGTVVSQSVAKGYDPLEVIRSAWYVSIGLSGLGVLVAIVFLIRCRHSS